LPTTNATTAVTAGAINKAFRGVVYSTTNHQFGLKSFVPVNCRRMMSGGKHFADEQARQQHREL
jgi:hypothetical protein